jgi:hypothetical protein
MSLLTARGIWSALKRRSFRTQNEVSEEHITSVMRVEETASKKRTGADFKRYNTENSNLHSPPEPQTQTVHILVYHFYVHYEQCQHHHTIYD